MARFYKGVYIGSHLHLPANDPLTHGIQPRNPAAGLHVHVIMDHIANGSTFSPLISLTRSLGVARDYAIEWSASTPTGRTPAYVFVIDIPDSPDGRVPGAAFSVIDPVCSIAAQHSNPLTNFSYHHDGDQEFLLGVVDEVGMISHLRRMAALPPGSKAIPQPPRLTIELQAIVRALRDAEILIHGSLPRAFVTERYDVH
jgi:hypothetical protein